MTLPITEGKGLLPLVLNIMPERARRSDATLGIVLICARAIGVVLVLLDKRVILHDSQQASIQVIGVIPLDGVIDDVGVF